MCYQSFVIFVMTTSSASYVKKDTTNRRGDIVKETSGILMDDLLT